MPIRSTFIAFALAAAANSSALAEHKVGSKTVHDAFPDPSVAALAAAACGGDAVGVARMVKAGVDPNAKGTDAVTPLFWAITCENLRGIEALLVGGADPNYYVPKHFTLMQEAASYRGGRILRLLLQHGGNPNIQDGEDGDTPATEAIFLGVDGHWENYYALLENGYDINHADRVGHTIAISLATQDRWDKVLELLNRGYTYDLERLGKYMRFCPATDQQEKYRNEVFFWLQAHGVQPATPQDYCSIDRLRPKR